MDLYTTQAVDAEKATQQQGKDFVSSFSVADIDAWLDTNTPKLQVVVDAGEITAQPEPDDNPDGSYIRIFFDIENAVDDRRLLLRVHAADVVALGFGEAVGGEVDTYRLTKGQAKNWANRTEALL